ncbi:MAG: hypothetical protein AAB779_00470 [Patescibacteria group bacterium]
MIATQMGNIGSEITRARVWQEKGDMSSRDRALRRALGLLDILLAQESNPARVRELSCLRGLITTQPGELRELEEYCLPFALLARKNA